MLDACADARPYAARHADVGRDEDGDLVAALWPHVAAVDVPALAAALRNSASRLTDDDAFASAAVDAAVILLESPPSITRDVEWLRGRALRGLGFAVPPLGEAASLPTPSTPRTGHCRPPSVRHSPSAGPRRRS